MPNGTPLSQTYQLKDAMARVLSRLGITDADSNMKPKIINESNAQQKIIAKKLRETDPAVKVGYEETATVVFVSGEVTFVTVEVSNPIIVEPVRLEATNADTTSYGTIPFIDDTAFNNLRGFSYFDNSLLHTIVGRRLKLFSGQNVSTAGMTFKLIYIREVNTLVNDADYVDLPNSTFDELINSVVPMFEKKVEEEVKA